MIIETNVAEAEAQPVTPTETIIDMIYNPVLEEEQVFPLACQGCKLLDRFKEGMNTCHAIRPRYDLRKLPEAKGTILIIVPSPGEREDKAGHPLTLASGGAFLNSYISNLDNHWVVANSQGCYAGKDNKGKKIKLSKPQAEKCQNEYVRELIKQLRPKVVVFLGLEPMQCVLGPHAPKTLGKALGDPIKFPENEYFIIGAEDPSNHMTQRKDLEKTYMALFQQADRLCNGDYHEEVVEYELVTTTSRLKELSRSLSLQICLDTEDDRNLGRNLGGSNLPKKSIWHPGVNLILLQITERVDTFYEPFKLKNYIFVPEILTKENIISLIKGRTLLAHSAKNDIQVLWTTKRVNCFKYASYKCTFLQFVSMDQGQMGNGLKERCRLHFNLNDYSQELWRDIDSTNKAIADSHSLLAGLIKEEEKKYKEVDKLREKQAKADASYQEKLVKWQAHEDANLQREANGKKPLKAKAKPERKEYEIPDLDQVEANLERYRFQQTKLRPLKDATFADVTPSVLFEYAAKDTFYGYKIQDEVLDQYAAAGAINPLCTELNHRAIITTAMIERWGLAIDMQRHRILSDVIDKKVAELKEQLIQNKYVQEALSRTQEVVDLSNEGKLTYEYLRDEAIKPNKKKFLAQLLLVTGVINEYSPTTKSSEVAGNPKEYKIDSSVLEDISGGLDETDDLFKKKSWTPTENKTEVNWVWFYIWHYRKLLDLQRKFLKSLGSLAVNDRLHPDFLIGRVEQGKTANGTITGRLATQSPNLLNIKKDKALRWIFPAKLNHEIDSDEDTSYIKDKKAWLVEIDYSSQEIAIASVVTGCKAWQFMFAHGYDIYSCVCNDLYGGGIDVYNGDPEVVRAQLKAKYPKFGPGSAIRDDSKTSCLGWLFKQQPWAFSNRTGIPLPKVEEFYRKMAKLYPEVVAYHKSIESKVNSGEMIENLFGLRRSTRLQMTGDRKRDHKNRLRLVAQLTNFLIQSCAAGQSLTLAYHVCMWILENNLENYIQMNNLVHDSIVFTIDDEFLEEAEKNINAILYNMKLLPFDMKGIVLGHSFKIGKTLGDLKQINSIAEWRREQTPSSSG